MPKRAIFDKKNVLVTGGAGFIGSHLCDELVKNNKVICVDNFITGSEKNIDRLLANPNFAFIKANINEPIDLEATPELQRFKIQFQGVQEIYNLACPTSPVDFKKNIQEIILTNSLGIKNMLDLAVKYNSTFIQFSSSVVYGPRRKDNNKIAENDLGFVDPVGDRSSHDEGKRFAETMVANYSKIHGLDAKIARVFRAYGPRMKLEDKQMIPDFIYNALENKDLVIYGNENFNTSLCYISDLIDAIIKLSASDVKEPINIGSDQDENLTQVANKIIQLTNSKSKIVYKEAEFFVTQLAVPDIAKAKAEINWMPITTLDNGLEKTVDALRASKGLLGVEHAV
ncbi:MAG: NAD-dependent epimerase/dehydratase family protein [Patescibacteria group bacterium]|jgi:UDP-glucuronate decarboxylase